MASITFDTLSYSKKLRSTGISEQQAEVHAEALAEIIQNNLVTKQDLDQLKLEIRYEMQQLELRITIKLGTLITIAIGVVATLVKLL